MVNPNWPFCDICPLSLGRREPIRLDLKKQVLQGPKAADKQAHEAQNAIPLELLDQLFRNSSAGGTDQPRLEKHRYDNTVSKHDKGKKIIKFFHAHLMKFLVLLTHRNMPSQSDIDQSLKAVNLALDKGFVAQSD
jgi:hypothetical protein